MPASPRLLLIACLSLFPVIPAANAAQGTIDLAWDNCIVDATTMDRSFACNTDTNVFYLLGMFTLTAPITGFNGAEGTLLVTFSGPTVPDWWQMIGATACRNGTADRLSPSFFPSCNIPYDPFGSQDGWALEEAGPLPNQVRLHFSWGSTGHTNLTPGVRYLAFVGQIRTSYTVSASPVSGAPCPGCSQPACFQLESINLYGSGGGLITQSGQRSVVSWQGGVPGVCGSPTPAHPQTWGRLKTLYR